MEKINLKERLKERFSGIFPLKVKSNSESLEVPEQFGTMGYGKIVKGRA